MPLREGKECKEEGKMVIKEKYYRRMMKDSKRLHVSGKLPLGSGHAKLNDSKMNGNVVNSGWPEEEWFWRYSGELGNFKITIGIFFLHKTFILSKALEE